MTFTFSGRVARLNALGITLHICFEISNVLNVYQLSIIGNEYVTKMANDTNNLNDGLHSSLTYYV